MCQAGAEISAKPMGQLRRRSLIRLSEKGVHVVRNALKEKNWSYMQLAKHADISRTSVARFLAQKPVSLDVFSSMCQSLEIQLDEVSVIEELSGRAPSNDLQKIETDALANRLELTLKKLEAEFSDLKSQTGDSLKRDDLEGAIEELKQARDQAINISENIVMPKDLNLKLVRADLLDRLDEYRSQEGHNFLMLGLFGGGAFAILINWLTSTENVRTDSSVALLCILIALIFFFGYKTFETNLRASKVKKQILEDS